MGLLSCSAQRDAPLQRDRVLAHCRHRKPARHWQGCIAVEELWIGPLTNPPDCPQSDHPAVVTLGLSRRDGEQRWSPSRRSVAVPRRAQERADEPQPSASTWQA